MKKIISYEAEDGTIFSNYEDCFNYELNSLIQKVQREELIFFDSLYQKLNYFNLQDIINIFNKSRYIYIKDIFGICLTKTLNLEFGFRLPEEHGYWYYDTSSGNWKSLVDKINSTTHILEQLRENINK